MPTDFLPFFGAVSAILGAVGAFAWRASAYDARLRELRDHIGRVEARLIAALDDQTEGAFDRRIAVLEAREVSLARRAASLARRAAAK